LFFLCFHGYINLGFIGNTPLYLIKFSPLYADDLQLNKPKSEEIACLYFNKFHLLIINRTTKFYS